MLVVEAVAVEHGMHARLQRLGRRLGAEAEVEVDHHARPGSRSSRRCRRGCWTSASWSAESASLPRVPLDGREFGERRRELVDRVARELRIGDVALHAAAP